ncbi:MAG: sulfatase-like hydrolase/transferase [Flavipsychrobacter sp.]|nr:sulfatase-like hydrolase/transferase [Flavipsychrobacter sp.]
MNIERVIVFIIDGMHWQAPSLLGMNNYNALAADGTSIEQSCMIVPHHPTVGEYGQLHSTSFPNPVLQEGTIFVKKGNRMLQDVFGPDELTAFMANSKAYESVTRGFDICEQYPGHSDEKLVKRSMELLDELPVRYMRIHLQTPGNEGRYLTMTSPDKPYYRNIWGEGSPYAAALTEADRHLGVLISFLDKKRWMQNTLLIVTGDHGQSVKGWHPVIDKDSSLTPLLFHGPSIARNRALPYFEHTDISPTIAALLQKEPPNKDGGSGLFIESVMETCNQPFDEHPRYIETINKQLNEYNALRARILIQAEADSYYSSFLTYLENELLTPEPFYHQDRFSEWYRAGSTRHLVEVNQGILEKMRQEVTIH